VGEPTAFPIYQFKVTLVGVKPPVWRRLIVPSSVTLKQLHNVLQIAFGWLSPTHPILSTKRCLNGSEGSLTRSISIAAKSIMNLLRVFAGANGRFEATRVINAEQATAYCRG
jgi:hypothetical protein